ncbi:MAG TPA: cytochrome c [Ramlibacter sp.]|uniref:c-type cytochrome n=1 Tax=Ramlibacter sp. TaxID=1917967 RepID=UPI002BBFA1EC|nr:cytochrome c [Ramlibacter sp.]HVZ46322.1 cytochrome c [Ramlibacter sp.]
MMRLDLLGISCALCCALTACERQMKDMYRQPRYDTGEASPLFPDTKSMRPPPEGSVPAAIGERSATSSGRGGREELAAREIANAASGPAPMTLALLKRGQERYSIYCLPCHSALGDGDGPVVRRGFPRPPSYHEQRLRDAPDRHFFDVITNGYGVMYPYADRITPEDRWAIVAYIRALQLSRNVKTASLPADARRQRAALPGASGAAR